VRRSDPVRCRASPSRSRTCSSPTGSPPSATSTGSPRRRRPTSPATDLASRLPTETGEALVVDDATETAHSSDPRATDSTRWRKSQRKRDRRREVPKTQEPPATLRHGTDTARVLPRRARGFVGAVARHGIDIAVGDATGAATLLVNVLGSFALGVLVTRAAPTERGCSSAPACFPRSPRTAPSLATP